jgi:hypothetical protein
MSNTSEYTVLFSITDHNINNIMKKEYPGRFIENNTSEFNKFISWMLNTDIIRLKRTYTIYSDDSKTTSPLIKMQLDVVNLREVLREAFDDFLKENPKFGNKDGCDYYNISLFKDTINHMNLEAHGYNSIEKKIYIVLLS